MATPWPCAASRDPPNPQMTTCELERPARAHLYAVAGRFISVEADDPRAADAFRRHFSGWHAEHAPAPRDGTPPAHDASVVVRTRGERPRAPGSFDSFEVACGWVCRTDGSTYFMESGGAVMRVGSTTPASVEVWVDAGPRAPVGEESARLVFNATMAALRRCGVFELHAAGAVEPESGRGLLFIGPSGCGKSTLATRLAAAGWHYLSDDLHLLHDAGDAVEARALRRVFGVNPQGAPAVREGLHGAAGPFDPDKLYFDPEAAFPGRFRESCAPRAIFFPVVTNEAESVARPLAQGEAMARLIRMCPWAGYDRPAARAHLGVLARLARQAAAYELRAGTDMLGDPSFAASFFRASAGGFTA
jgi:hypothetical protein